MPIKIIDLNAETGPTPDDLLDIRDNLTSTTRKISVAALFSDPPIPDGAITGQMIELGSITKAHLGEDAKISVRLSSQSSPATLTPNMDDYDIFAVTNLNGNVSIAAPTGEPVNGQGIMFRIKDNGTARSIGWNGIYRGIGVTLPTATVAGKTFYISGRWNTEAQKVDILGVAREA